MRIDIIYMVNHLLRAGPAPVPVPEAGDVNCDGSLALGDVIYLVNFLLRGGPSPCNACSAYSTGVYPLVKLCSQERQKDQMCARRS